MARTTTPVVVRLLEVLKSGTDLTTKQARARFGIKNVSARISELRQAGYAIYLNRRRNSEGKMIGMYHLSTPSRKMVAVANLVMSDPYFAPVVAEALNRVRSLDATLSKKS